MFHSQRFQQLLADCRAKQRHLETLKGSERATLAFELIDDFERLSGEIASMRIQLARHSPERQRYEDIIAQLSLSLLTKWGKTEKQDGGYSAWVHNYRKVWREEFHLFSFALAFFFASGVIGWTLGLSSPELSQVVIPQHLLENILDRNPWFEHLAEDPINGALGLAVNNILVAIKCFFASALLGLGGWFILGMNGLFFGAVVGFCQSEGFHEPLLNFVISHGPLELTIIIASAFAGFIYGKVFFMRPYSRFLSRLSTETKRAGVVAVGIIPWLTVAAIFEAFVSPWHYFSFNQKLISGIAIAAAFWLWTFASSKPLKEESATYSTSYRP